MVQPMNNTSETSEQDAVSKLRPEDDELSTWPDPDQNAPVSPKRQPQFTQCAVTCPLCGATHIATLEQIHDGTWLHCPTCEELQKKAA